MKKVFFSILLSVLISFISISQNISIKEPDYKFSYANSKILINFLKAKNSSFSLDNTDLTVYYSDEKDIYYGVKMSKKFASASCLKFQIENNNIKILEEPYQLKNSDLKLYKINTGKNPKEKEKSISKNLKTTDQVMAYFGSWYPPANHYDPKAGDANGNAAYHVWLASIIASQRYYSLFTYGNGASGDAFLDYLAAPGVKLLSYFGHGETTYGNCFFDNSWMPVYSSQLYGDFTGKLFFLYSCCQFSGSWITSFIDQHNGRTFISSPGLANLDYGGVSFKEWWNLTINADFFMGPALTSINNQFNVNWAYAGSGGALPPQYYAFQTKKYQNEISNIVNYPKIENKLNENYPNPFNPSTKISYSVIENTHVNLIIYNSFGQIVDILVNDNKNPGEYSIVWTPKNNCSSGLYFCQLVTKNYRKTIKLNYTK